MERDDRFYTPEEARELRERFGAKSNWELYVMRVIEYDQLHALDVAGDYPEGFRPAPAPGVLPERVCYGYQNDMGVHYESVTVAEALRVLAWMRGAYPDALAVIEEHTGKDLHLDNCENEDALVMWVHLQLSCTNDHPEGPDRGGDYAYWPDFVRDFYDAVWNELWVE